MPKETLRALLDDYRDHMLVKDIAEKYGISMSGVSKLAKRHGLSRRSSQNLSDEDRGHYRYLRGVIGLTKAREWREEILAKQKSK